MPAKQKPKKQRADLVLAASGLASSQSEAAARIMTGKVMHTDHEGKERKVLKPGDAIYVGSSFRFTGAKHPYVSRGGLKLEAALATFSVSPKDKICADIGISTGGFTDGLLQAGARRVHGVDVGYGQTAWKIRTDPRVVLYERTNVRHMAPDAFGEAIELLTIDVSFVGLAGLLPTLKRFLAPGASMFCLVKPQFELPANEIPAGGIVSDPDAHRRAVEKVIAGAIDQGLKVCGEIKSPIKGAEGNLEYLVWLK
jgi:23S rRNA (cytidine1920-2'-O)/16S rRNA (cytidine1409-2'-O)-methyltransferase